MTERDSPSPDTLRNKLDAARRRIAELEDAVAGGRTDCCSHYNSLFQDNHAVMVLIDPESRVVVDANKAACEFYGYTRRQLSGKHLAEINTLSPAAIEKEIAKARARSKHHFDFRHRLASGEVRDVEVYSGPIRHEGRELLYSLVFDVTERKADERLREDMERMARHDLKSPLNGVVNIPEILMLDHNLTDDQRQALQMIIDSGQAMLNLINMSQDIFKMEKRTYRFDPEPVDLADMLGRLAANHSMSAAAKGLVLDVYKADPGAPYVADASQPLCRNLFSNLLANAADAAPAGSRLSITLAAEPADLRVDIANPGVVPAKIRDVFFEKYSTSGKKYGLGLGAYSARLMAETMGGSVTMETSDERGETVLTVRLPRRME